MEIERVLIKRYPGEGLRETYRRELATACRNFVQSGLADPKYISELSSTDDGKFWACISEALIYRQLREQEFPERTGIGAGPDFLIEYEGKRIWVEVVCPMPTGVPFDWLNFTTSGVGEVPHNQILLRWTSAIKDKVDKLQGSASVGKGYLDKGVVGSEDVFVIAVNGCQLRHGPFSALDGISQFPYAVEAVFPIGPRQLTLDSNSQKVIDAGYQERHIITKPNGAPIPSYLFLQPSSHMVSAIWALDLNGGSCVGNSEPAAVVHNPNAKNRLPVGFLPAEREYGARSLGDDEYEFFRY